MLLPKRNIGLVAHDNKKNDLVEWVDFNKGMLSLHNLYATGNTGQRIMDKTRAENHSAQGWSLRWRYGAWRFDCQ